MTAWRHRVTVHEADEVVQHLEETVEHIPPSIYCDDEGICYFDEGPNPFTDAIEHILDGIGESGWELVHVLFRPGQMICFWKQPQ